MAHRGLDEFLAQEAKNQEIAALNIPSWAGNIKVGDYFVREWEDLTIWGVVLPNEWEAGVVTSYEGRAYRFARNYSIECPNGELGDVHLSEIGRLVSKAEFEKAKADGWAKR